MNLLAQLETALQNVPQDGQSAVVYVMGVFLSMVTAALVAMWRDNKAQQKATEEKLKDCEDDRKKLWEEIASIKCSIRPT